MVYKKAKLILEDKSIIKGFSFGFPSSVSGEVVFNTGMAGYVESFTDPSYSGQILTLTYPLIGNYGVPEPRFFESEKIQIKGLIVSEYCEKFSHHGARQSLSHWLKENKVPAIFGVDTRELTKKLRESGVMLGKIIISENIKGFADPNKENLVSKVSCFKPKVCGRGQKKIIAVDCGIKNNILRCLLRRDIRVKLVPWNYDFTKEKFDGLFISNGPGDPVMCGEIANNLKKIMERNVPIFGICMGNLLLGLAAGAKTYKLKYGHRSQNQPVIEAGTNRCFITSQNHGYTVDSETLPSDWQVWFKNANDGTVEGIRHKNRPWFGVQFHPEAAPGPTDTEWLFDLFVKTLKH